jgi:hypothetical protein
MNTISSGRMSPTRRLRRRIRSQLGVICNIVETAAIIIMVLLSEYRRGLAAGCRYEELAHSGPRADITRRLFEEFYGCPYGSASYDTRRT